MRALWPAHGEDEIEAVSKVLRSGRTNFWTGDEGRAFEAEFAVYVGATYALAVSNGTVALELALKATHQSIWGDVLVPCRTFMATASAVVRDGGSPVLVDIDARSLNVTPATLEERRVRWGDGIDVGGVIVVHYAGAPCDMEAIRAWTKEHNLFLIEDCAHAHGSRIGTAHVGTFGDVGCFSFCVGKIMSTGGEGGMVVTNDLALYDKMRAFRDHGRYQMVGNPDATGFEYTVAEFGTNYRMTEMQAAIGRAQLKKLDKWVARRNQIADAYNQYLPSQEIRPGSSTGRYMYVAFVEGRDRMLADLNARGIPARVGGCPNIGHEPVFAGNADPCPVADAVGKTTLALPVYPTMTDDDVGDVISALAKVA